MARTVTLDGVNYSIPENGDEGWGSIVTDFLEAITLDTLQPSGGLFTLTAEVDFGATYGLKSAYFLSRTVNAATAGAVRLASTDLINWRNPANSSNYVLQLNSSSERLSFRGIDLVDLSSSQTLRGKTLSSATLVNATISGLSLSSLGALEVAGNTVLGNDEANDTVILNSRISSPLTPKSSSTDLGSNSNRWGDLYSENISASGTLTVGTLNAGSVDFSNATALSLSVSGPLTASSVSAASLSASGALAAGTATLSNVSAVTLSTSGRIESASTVSALRVSASSSVSATKLSVNGSSSQLVTDGDFTYDAAQGSFLGRANGVVGPIGGGSGGDSWTMSDIGSNQIRFNEGDRVVNGIVYSTSGDVNTNSSVVAITNDTLTLLNSSNGMLYAASGSVRVFTFYDIIDGTFHGIGNSTESSNYTWDYRNENPNFNINLSRYVPLGYVDVSATGNPGTITYTITNWPVGPWTTFNNVAAAEAWQDWTPTVKNTGGMTASSTTIDVARYRRVGNSVQFYCRFDTTLGGSAGSQLNFSAPVPIFTTASFPVIGAGSSGTEAVIVQIANNDTVDLHIRQADFGIFALATTTFYVFGEYETTAADGYNPIAVGFPNVTDLVTVKTLSSDVTTDTTVSDLTVNNLVIGKTYEVYMNGAFEIDSDNSVLLSAVHDSATLGSIQLGSANSNDFFRVSGYIAPFTATAASLTFETISFGAGDVLRGNGATTETHIVVKEIPQAGIGVLLPAAANQDVSAKSADYTITDSDNVRTVLVTTSSTDRTITLPTAADNTNREIIVKKVDSGTGTVIIDGESSETIDGAATYTLYNQYAWIKIVCDGTNWSIIAQGADIGTFTPTLGPASGSFASITYVSQQGNYEIVGNRLFFDVAVVWSACSVGSATGDLRVQGLPFPSAATTDVIVNCQLQNINTTTGAVSISGNVLENSPPSSTAVAEIGQTMDSGSLVRVQAVEAASGSFNKFIHLSGSYPI